MTYYSNIKIQFVLGLVMLLMAQANIANAQSISGSTSVNQGSIQNYTILNPPSGINSVTWYPYGPATIMSSNSSFASIRWDGAGSSVLNAMVRTTYSTYNLSIQVQVNGLPVGTVSTPSGTSKRCKGSGTSQYSASASNAVSYSWTISPSGAGSINSSGKVTWNSGYSGSATVKVTAHGSDGSSSNKSKTVTVYAPPTKQTIGGVTSVCAGSSTTISIQLGESGINYQLYKNNAVDGSSKSGTGSTLVWTGKGVGTYKIIAKRANGYCSSVEMNNQLTVGTKSPGSISISTDKSPVNLCPGTSVTLTASGGSNYSWSNGTSGSKITVSPSSGSNTTYTVTGKESLCSTSKNSSKTVTAQTTVGTVSTPTGTGKRCKGSGSSDYNASAPYATSYTWTLTPSEAGSINSSGLVTWNSGFSGTATVKIKASGDCSSTSTKSKTVKVYAPPIKQALTGASYICPNTTSNLAMSSQQWINYQLYKNNTASGSNKAGTGSTLVWADLGAGTYKVIATRSNGYCSSIEMSNQLTIQTVSLGEITISTDKSPVNLCPGTSVTLTASGGGNYSWSNGSTESSITVSPTSGSLETHTVTGLESVCLTSSSSSKSVSAQTVVGSVSTLSGASSACEGSDPIDYNASASDATSYTWSISPVAAGSIDANGAVSWGSEFSGIATVKVVANGACGSASSKEKEVEIIETPDAPTVIDNENSCSSEDVVLQAMGPNLPNSVSHIWYTSESGSELEDATQQDAWMSTLTKTAQSADYWVSAVYHGCESNTRSKVSGTYVPNVITVLTKQINYMVSPVHPMYQCEGIGSEIYASGGQDGSEYRWYDASTNDLIQTGDTYAVNLAYDDTNSGIKNYYLKGTLIDVRGCTREIATPVDFSITVLPLPKALQMSDATVTNYFGTSAMTRVDPLPVEDTWFWQNEVADGFSDTNSDVIYESNASGTFYLRARHNTSQCWSESLAIPLDVTPIPQLLINGEQTLEWGETAHLSVNDEYDSYEWQYNNQIISSENGSAGYTVRTPGNYKVIITKSGVTDPYSSANVKFNSLIDNQDLNFITSTVIKTSIKEETDIGALQINERAESTRYFDGLGRPMQTVVTKNSPSAKDIIAPIAYDEFGRQPKSYLPYVHTDYSDGLYQINSLDLNGDDVYANGEQYDFYQNQINVAHDTHPYAESIIEASPLNRVLKQGAPGAVWQPEADLSVTTDHVIRYGFETNTKTGENDCVSGCDDVMNWEIVSGLPASTLYDFSQLYKNITTDEAGHQVITFTNKSQQTILKKVESGDANNPWLQTYYVYDDFGNLKFVLPPMIFDDNETIDGNELNDYAFQYKYDVRQRMIEKKVPGAGWVYMAYDKRDRLILTQDANQRNPNIGEGTTCTFTKYDFLNRPILTGTYFSTMTTQVVLQTEVETKMGVNDIWSEAIDIAGVQGYADLCFPDANIQKEILTVTYYDNYNFTNTSFASPPAGRFTTNDNKVLPVAFDGLLGLVTGSKTKVLGSADQYVESVVFYDEDYRAIQSQTINFKGDTEILTSQYDFSGQLRKTYLEHLNSDDAAHGAINLSQEYEYDHAGRLLTVSHLIGDDEANKHILLTNTYNELGELISKELDDTPNETFKPKINYAYNIRGWLKSINDPNVVDPSSFFAMKLMYDEADQYNGNIGAIDWKNHFETSKNAYTYAYDPLNRLTDANYASPNGGDHSVSDISYDANGNILTLNRKGVDSNGGVINMDYLAYDYAGLGNQLTNVKELTGGSTTLGFVDGDTGDDQEYFYDDNGNMKQDNNKGITDITYNYLNLPEKVTFSATKYIQYTYDASGTKLSQKVVEEGKPDKVTDYLAGIIYEDNQLQFIQHDEGRIVPNESDWKYQYMLKDHLGNVRATIGETSEPYLATMENSTWINERNYFENSATVTRINAPIFNHTAGASDSYSIRLAGGIDNIGLAKSLPVKSGDVITTEVYAKYIDVSTTGQSAWTGGLASLFQDISDGASSVVAEGANPGAASIPAAFLSLLDYGSDNSTGPQAYLNVLQFDKDYNLLAFSYEPVTEAAKETGTNLPNSHQKLSSSITISQPGFIYIYLSNEIGSMVGTGELEVYFDDFSIVHDQEMGLISQDDYYPFGGSFNSYTKAGMIDQNFKFTGKEEINDLGVNWQDFGARMYDSWLGRWNHIDPLADALSSVTPYNYALNNPIVFIDPDGAYPWSIHVRSFISTPTTGGGLFRGDGRGPSFTGTSRVRSEFTVDPSARTVAQPFTESDFTLFYGIPGKLPPLADIGSPDGLNDNISFSGSTASFDFSHFGKDPITPQWATPALDVHAGLSFNEDLDKGILTITGSFTGDKFPSTESFITDQSGETKLFLGFHMEDGGLHSLFGDNKKPLFNVNMQIMFNDKGNFTGVRQGDTTYSVEEWNKKMNPKENTDWKSDYIYR